MSQQDMDRPGCLAGCDRTPRDPAVQPTPGQLLHSLHTMSREDQLGAAQRMLEASDTAVRCFTRDHEGRLLRDDHERLVLLWLHAEAVWQRDVAHRIVERMETGHVEFGGPDGERIHPDWCRECRVQALKDAIADIDRHATPIGLLDENDPEGSPHHYVVTVGALHRALGKAYTAEPCESERERLRTELDRAEASRRDWAAEAAGLLEKLERLENAALNPAALYSGVLVGVGGEHDTPPNDEQCKRAAGLIERAIRRAMGPGYITQAENRLVNAVYGGHLCVCVTDEQAANLNPKFTRPECAVHPEADR